jgi:hypothetical protein
VICRKNEEVGLWVRRLNMDSRQANRGCSISPTWFNQDMNRLGVAAEEWFELSPYGLAVFASRNNPNMVWWDKFSDPMNRLL